ncbi:MAG: helix-turn-helix transcriptional regulator [Methylovulum sp.]
MTNSNNSSTDVNTHSRLIRRPEVQSLIGLSRSSIYSKLDPKSPQFDSTFPKPINLGSRSIAWVYAEIQSWIASRVADREVA